MRSDDQVGAAEVIAALSLATDLGMGFPLEHGLHSTSVAMRLCARMGVDAETTSQVYYSCLLCYVGCTADAEIQAELFDEGALLAHFAPVMYGSRRQTVAGIMRALAASPGAAPTRAVRAAVRLPRAVGGHRAHVAALCEVAQMLTDRLGLPPSVGDLFAHLTERWDGKGEPGRLKGEQVPLSLRIVHVARDASFQRLLGGDAYAAEVVRTRAGNAFDPEIATLLASEAKQLLELDPASAWDDTIASEPAPQLELSGAQIHHALAAIGEFTDLMSPFLVGHSNGVAELAGAAAQRCHLAAADVTAVRRAALVHDVGRVAVPARVWQKAGPLTPDEWEQVRLHAVLHRTYPAPVAVSGHTGSDRGLPPRAPRRQRLSPRRRRAGAHPRGSAPGRCRRLPRDDRAAAVPRGAHAGPGGTGARRRSQGRAARRR